jgi:hypothetical protein
MPWDRKRTHDLNGPVINLKNFKLGLKTAIIKPKYMS